MDVSIAPNSRECFHGVSMALSNGFKFIEIKFNFQFEIFNGIPDLYDFLRNSLIKFIELQQLPECLSGAFVMNKSLLQHLRVSFMNF